MEYVGLFVTLSVSTAMALVDKRVSRELDSRDAVLFFSFFKTLLCALFALPLLFFGPVTIDLPGVVVSLFAGAFHAASVLLILYALQNTLGVYVNLFLSAGVVMPSVFGFLFLGQPVTVWSILALALLLVGLAMTLGVRRGGAIELKLLLPMFLFYGLLMVTQGSFSHFSPTGSKTVFSLLMYSFSTLLLGLPLLWRKKKALRLTNLAWGMGTVLSASNLAVNLLLTGLSASLAAALVFPSIYGIKMVALTLLSPFLWKEKLRAVQVAGSLLTVLCICVLSL